MDRLTTTTKYPLTTFKRCQICGFESDDKCSFRMFTECDDSDHPEYDNVIVVCDNEKCRKVIDDHPRLYQEIPWQANFPNGPGKFMLLCGDCKFRNGVKCSHPELKANGGKGLKVDLSKGLPIVHISYADGTGITRPNMSVAVECAGRSII